MASAARGSAHGLGVASGADFGCRERPRRRRAVAALVVDGGARGVWRDRRLDTRRTLSSGCQLVGRGRGCSSAAGSASGAASPHSRRGADQRCLPSFDAVAPRGKARQHGTARASFGRGTRIARSFHAGAAVPSIVFGSLAAPQTWSSAHPLSYSRRAAGCAPQPSKGANS